MTYLQVYLVIALISWAIFFVSAYKKTWGTLAGSFLFAIAWPTAHIINYLMWRQSSRCAWCGKENKRDEATIKAHIMECDKHPMRQEIERYREALAGIMLLADSYTQNENERLALISLRCRKELEGCDQLTNDDQYRLDNRYAIPEQFREGGKP
jgi:hypothetical protein